MNVGFHKSMTLQAYIWKVILCYFQRGNRIGHGHCGLITYIHETFLSKEIAIENVHTSWDYLRIQLSHTSSNSRRYLLCNVYRLLCYLSEDINMFTMNSLTFFAQYST